MNIYDFKVRDVDGNEVSMSEYKDKVLLIVNTATGCGFTPQYKSLEELYKKYKDQGFEILDFPCNQFLAQAPGTNHEIVSFCQLKYGVTFKTFGKIDVNGKNADPLFDFIKDKTKALFGKAVKWNFTKFLVSRDGEVVSRFAPNVDPMDIEEKIVELLSQNK